LGHESAILGAFLLALAALLSSALLRKYLLNLQAFLFIQAGSACAMSALCSAHRCRCAPRWIAPCCAQQYDFCARRARSLGLASQ